MTEHESILDNLNRLADAIVAMFGKNCEACVHDLTALHHSLVAIRGTVTRRQPGAPATDLLVKLLNQNEGRGKDLHNYQTTSKDGRSLKSTTVLIRDRTGQAVAALCINFDTTDFYNAGQALLPFLNAADNGVPVCTETFSQSPDETIESLVQQAIGQIGRHPATMQANEKTRLVGLLEEHGIFRLKGAVKQVARTLGVTRFTVYNYLKKVRAEK
jgi:predicted transcriptional regulator YheO